MSVRNPQPQAAFGRTSSGHQQRHERPLGFNSESETVPSVQQIMTLEQITNGSSLVAVEPTQVVTVVAVVPMGRGRHPAPLQNTRLVSPAKWEIA
jgi:hypothetical protein